jgi:hypothetical protein
VGRYWNLRPDTAERHVVHVGETAVLTAEGAERIWLSNHKRNCYSLQVAMTNKDQASLNNAVERGEAFAIAAGSQVRVKSESVSAREIEVLDGPAAGKTGWVEFEYLRPRRSGEFR